MPNGFLKLPTVSSAGIGNAAAAGVAAVVVGELVLEQVIEIARQRAADVHPCPPKITAVAQRLFVGVVVGVIHVQPAAGLERKIAAWRLQLEALAVGDRSYPGVGLDPLARCTLRVQFGLKFADQAFELVQALLHGGKISRRRVGGVCGAQGQTAADGDGNCSARHAILPVSRALDQVANHRSSRSGIDAQDHAAGLEHRAGRTAFL
jgi:hypothetical protein